MTDLEVDELIKEIHKQANKLRAHLAGFIEACGLPERQERGAIVTMKQLSYDDEKRLVELVEEYLEY